jgi:hypothetical protein
MTAKDHDRAPRHVAYRMTREHITELALRPGVSGIQVPACPQWTVRDLVAHVAGHCARRIGETVDDAGLADLVDIWQRAAKDVERGIAAGTEDVALMTMDTFTHELDLCATLGVSPPEDHPAYPWAFDVVVGGLNWSITSHELPAVRLTCESASWVVGPGAPTASATAPRYDLYRSMTGRRTTAQISALDWSKDPGQWLPAFFWGPFSQPTRQSD